jgi:uncharacterized protein YbaR (Trm112 family)
LATNNILRVTRKHLKEAFNEGVMTFTCKQCKSSVCAEPDAQDVICQSCNKKYQIVGGI